MRHGVPILKRLIASCCKHAVLLMFSAFFIFPFIWMLSTSLKSNTQVFAYPPVWIPHPIVWHNYLAAVKEIAFFHEMANSLRYAVLSACGACLSSPLVAYGFTKIRWPGRDVFFFATLALLMLPGQVTLVPLFLEFHRLQWVGSYKPLIVPAFFGNPFAIFLARQFLRQVPNEMLEAARIDGAGELRIYWRIVLPSILPAIATIGLFQFLGAYHDFLGPLIYISRQSRYPLSIGLTFFEHIYSTQWQQLMAASALYTAPVLVVYFFVQRVFIRGIQFSGLVG